MPSCTTVRVPFFYKKLVNKEFDLSHTYILKAEDSTSKLEMSCFFLD
jgi:hypothetical protein